MGKKVKVLVALGTRPEVIKLAPVITALQKRTNTIVCATGQHREMLMQTLGAFGLKPDRMLDTMSPGRSLNILASRLLADMDLVLEEEQPDWVVVQGDTTTAFCAGLAAFHRGIRVAHVEAGLRTGDLSSPFPEEANRSLLARITTTHFAPTARARACLLSEGIPPASIIVTGNTVVDAIAQVRNDWTNGRPAVLAPHISEIADKGPLILVTCHRRENFGEVLDGFCLMLREQSARHANFHWVFPVHLNPSIREPVKKMLSGLPNLSLIEPVDYSASLYLISRSSLVVSDSGGIQEEAPSFGVPVVVMRQHTERLEGEESGFATLAGQSPSGVAAAIDHWLDRSDLRNALRGRENPYGDGHASSKIVSSLLDNFTQEFHG